MVELEDITVSETNQMKKDEYCVISLTYEIKINIGKDIRFVVIRSWTVEIR